MRMKNQKSRTVRRSFTLPELLLIAAVTAISFGLLLPTLNSARLRAYSTQCTGNQQACLQWQAAYAADNGGYMVMTGPKGRETFTAGMIYLYNKKYVKKGENLKFLCPSNQGPASKSVRKNPADYSWYATYALLVDGDAARTVSTKNNGFLSYPGANFLTGCYARPARLKSGAKVIMILDSICRADKPLAANRSDPWAVFTVKGGTDGAPWVTAHGKNCNGGYFDGHVEQQNADKLKGNPDMGFADNVVFDTSSM